MSKLLTNELGPFTGTDITIETGKTITGTASQFKITGGASGQAILTDGAGNLTFGAVDALPTQSGQAGKFLKTDGTDPSWSNLDPDAFPSQTGKDGWILTTDGTNVVWSDIINSAPAALDTLNELAASLADDADFAGTITTALAGKEPTLTAGTTTQYYRGDKTWQTLTVDPTMGGDLTGTASNAQIAAGAVDLVHMSADSVDSDQYVDGSIDNAHLAANSVDSDQYVDGSIDTDHIGDNQVTLAKIADGTQGDILYYGASGAPALLGVGTTGQLLKTQGSSANPVWVDAPASGGFNSVQVFTSSGTWNRPSGVTKAIVHVVGAGGGGGGGRSSYPNGADGAGAGGVAIKAISVASISTSTVTIGAAGTGGGTNANGVTGGNSIWADGTNTLTGSGGNYGGTGQGNTSWTGGAATGGTINSRGGGGENGFSDTYGHGGTGGVCASGFGGGPGVGDYHGNANPSPDPRIAQGYGHGGAGGNGAAGGGNKTGGAGAPGIVVVWEYK